MLRGESMESKKSTNFDFILKTSIESYYDLLKNAEKAWETHAALTYIALRMVDFPAPLAPISDTISPLFTSKLTSFVAFITP